MRYCEQCGQLHGERRQTCDGKPRWRARSLVDALAAAFEVEPSDAQWELALVLVEDFRSSERRRVAREITDRLVPHG